MKYNFESDPSDYKCKMAPQAGFLICLFCIIVTECLRPWRNMDERQRTLGVYDDVESLGRHPGDFDAYLAPTTQPGDLGSSCCRNRNGSKVAEIEKRSSI